MLKVKCVQGEKNQATYQKNVEDYVKKIEGIEKLHAEKIKENEERITTLKSLLVKITCFHIDSHKNIEWENQRNSRTQKETRDRTFREK